MFIHYSSCSINYFENKKLRLRSKSWEKKKNINFMVIFALNWNEIVIVASWHFYVNFVVLIKYFIFFSEKNVNYEKKKKNLNCSNYWTCVVFWSYFFFCYFTAYYSLHDSMINWCVRGGWGEVWSIIKWYEGS